MIATEPLAAAPLLPLDRRSLLKGGILGAGLISAPLAAAQPWERGFTHGVASGEPASDGVLLWTRFAADQDTRLEWQVSAAQDFAQVAAAGMLTAGPESDGCCKARAEGLNPGSWYYYRFRAPDGSVSDIGRTRTLPEGPTPRFRLGVFSCANIGFGWFNAYAHAAEADDIDCVLHTGDYYYEYARGSYPENPLAGRIVSPANEAVHLADYRRRLASYRSDPDLRRLHQMFPMIATWDDHETANDSWAGGAENHQAETEGTWAARKAAAMRAYHEWMPVSDEWWKSYEIGDLATIFRLETRLTARAKPFDLKTILEGKRGGDAVLAALTAFREGDYRDPQRHLLGGEQEAWLGAGLKRSRAQGKIWQVLAQQVLMGAVSAPPQLVDHLGDTVPPFVRKLVALGSAASRAGLPLNMDSWDGYPAARTRVFTSALAADANILSLAGDSHNGWASNLSHKGERVGIEFAGQSVTSPGFEAYLGPLPPDDLARMLRETNPGLAWTDTSHRGYMMVELTPERATSEYRLLASVRQRGTRLAARHQLTSTAGSRQIVSD